MAGGGAAAVNILFTFPIYKAMFRQQAYGQSLRVVTSGMAKEGIGNLYRGIAGPCLQKTGSVALMFGMYHWHYAAMLPIFRYDHFYTTLAAGLATGTTEAVVFAPVERILALLQATEYNTKFKGFFDATLKLRSYGWAEYYRGFYAVFLRNGPQTVLFFHLKPQVTTFLDRNAGRLKSTVGEQCTNWLVNFCSGAAIAAFTSTVFYPLSVVKSRMQFKLGGEFENPYTVLRQLTMKQRFAGVQTNIFRAFVSWGIINASYEGFIQVLRD